MTKKKDVFYGGTDTGKQRDNNEDAFIAFYSSDHQHVIAAVIDGVGGYEGGEIAAAIAQEVLTEHFKAVQPDLTAQMKEAIYQTNERIYAESLKNPEFDHMACVLTLAVADPANNSFSYAHVGDTRLYLFRDNSLVKVTRDHSFVGFLEDSKRISEEEAMNHPKRNEINKALGFEPNIRPIENYIETGISPFLPGDILLLCSDGLSDLLNRQEIIFILEKEVSLAVKVKNLIEAANDAGGKDNITAVLVANTNSAKEQEATKPVYLKKNEQRNEVKSPEPNTNTIQPEKKKGSRGLITGIIIAILLVSAAFLYWNRSKTAETITTSIAKKQERNPQEKRLDDSIQKHTILILSDSVYNHQVIFTDTLHLNKDSVFIKGNGIVLKADSLFKGPAFQISTANKITEISNITFEDFSTAILTSNINVILKNVRFKNCSVPLKITGTVPYSYVWNGILSDTATQKDTTTQRPSRRHE